MTETAAPYTVVLGIAQDGGYPQAGDRTSPAWGDPTLRRSAACLGLADPRSGQRWLFDATPDFKEQLFRFDQIAPHDARPGLDAIFLTHAHIGHYTGLMHLGIEAMGAQNVPVYVMPRMQQFLSENGPWAQLVQMHNVELRPLHDGRAVSITNELTVTPVSVPHRDEYSETVAFRIQGPRRSVLFMPDIAGWDAWERCGTRIEDVLNTVDIAYLDGTFMSGDELPGRDLSKIQHPMVDASLARFADLPEGERHKVRFIHLNQSNPLLRGEASALAELKRSGCGVAHEGEIVGL